MEAKHDWTQDAPRLARSRCSLCKGSGLVEFSPCNCVARRIFFACWERYQSIALGSRQNSPVVKSKILSCSRPFEEYLGDFAAVGRRALREQSPDHTQFFNTVFVNMGDMVLAAKRLKLSPARADEIARDIANLAGTMFREIKPYALFPVNEYFAR